MSYLIRCFICKRERPAELSMRVDFGKKVGIQIVCHICWERGNEE